MISSWFKGVFFVLLRSSAIAIDCLLGCFPVEEDEDNFSATHIVPEPDPIDPVVSRNRTRVYSLLHSAEKEVSPCKGKGRHDPGTLQPDIEVGVPKDEEDSSDPSVLTAVQFLSTQSTTSREDLIATISPKGKSKFVHFEFGESGLSSFSSRSSSSSLSDSESRKQSEEPSAARANKHMLSKDPSFSSPYPTPFKLTDDMQTPGTVFTTSYQAITGNVKNPRIRSQYVYSYIDPIQTFSRPKKVLLEEEEAARRDLLEQAGDDDDESTPKSKLGISNEGTPEKGLNVESRFFSQLLRASPTNQSTNNKHPSGSPDSPTKYKEEDDKVELQGTPFEKKAFF